jgi:hypothetical protein
LSIEPQVFERLPEIFGEPPPAFGERREAVHRRPLPADRHLR